jgi:hypothetical protein
MNIDNLFIVTFHPIFNENANILSTRIGVPIIQEMVPKKNYVYIVFGAHEQADKLLYIQEALNNKYIIIQTEQIESKVFDNKYYMELIQTNPVLEWSKKNVEKLKSNIDLKVYGLYFYDNFIINNNEIKFEDREIDFFFCGSYSKEREQILNEFMNENPKYKYEIDMSYNYTNPIELTNKLKKVKYVINLPYYKNNVLETHRINKALSIGCEVISLYSSDESMNKKYMPYVHFVSELNDFSLLFETPKKSNYLKLMEDFGKKSIENTIHAIFFAYNTIIKEQFNNEQIIQENNKINNKINESIKPITEPVNTEFAKFLQQKKLNEKLDA